MKYVQIESKDVLSKIVDGATVYCVDVASKRCMTCSTMTLEAIKSFVNNLETTFLIEGSDKEDTKETNGKKKQINDSFF